MLSECPKCGSTDISAGDSDWPAHDHMVQEVTCNNCGAEFSETYKGIEWEGR